MRNTTERRQSILEYLCECRHSTRKRLAYEFCVSSRTIERDLLVLSCSYPIYMMQGNGGGVHVVDGFRLGKKYMTGKQSELLEKLAIRLTGEDFETIKSIIKTFKEPKRGNKCKSNIKE